MQATQIKVGDKVRPVDAKDVPAGATNGVVVGRRSLYWEVNWLDGAEEMPNPWLHPDRELAVMVGAKSTPTIASDLKITPQAKTVLRHLQKRKSISPAEALNTYCISRLASCVHEIRKKAGYVVDCTINRDEMGHKYARYSLQTVH